MKTCNYYVKHATYSGAYQANRRIKPKGIIIHSTGAENPDLKRWVYDIENAGENPNENYFCGKNDVRQVIPHAVFGYDKYGKFAIENILPYDYRCWGCGYGDRGSYNDCFIQIEIAEDYGLPRDYLDVAMNCVAEWCARLMIKYKDITIDDIISHKEAHDRGYASNHGDPEHWLEKFGLTMDDFRKLISEWYSKICTEEGYENSEKELPNANEPKKYYKVQLGAFSTYDAAKNYSIALREKYGLDTMVVIPK